MIISLEERLAALDEAKAKIIHDSFLEEQQKLEDEIRKKMNHLKESAAEKAD